MSWVVGGNYVPVQNRECFSFLDAVVADGGLRYHTAGALRMGERIWLLAKLPGTIRVRFSEDITEKYLLLSNSHDGSSTLRVHYTSIRVVCSNTLSLADHAGRGEGVAIRHQGNLASKVRDAQTVLGLARRYFDDLEGQMDVMARHYPNYSQVSGYFRNLVPDPDEGNKSRAQNVRDRDAPHHRIGDGEVLGEHFRPWHETMDQERTEQDRHAGTGGHTEHDSRHQCAAFTAVGGRFGCDHAANVALAERFGRALFSPQGVSVGDPVDYRDTDAGHGAEHWGPGVRPPLSARIAAGVSLVLWVLVVTFGRWIGFTLQ